MKTRILYWLLVTLFIVSNLFYGIDEAFAKSRGKGSSSGYKSYKGAKAIDGDRFRHRGKSYREEEEIVNVFIVTTSPNSVFTVYYAYPNTSHFANTQAAIRN